MSYFNLIPIIKRYKEQMFEKFGFIIKKVKWNKEQLDLMQKSMDFDYHDKDVHTINIGNLKVR